MEFHKNSVSGIIAYRTGANESLEKSIKAVFSHAMSSMCKWDDSMEVPIKMMDEFKAFFGGQ